MTTDRKVILYIATSLDGYIAKPNDDLNKFLQRIKLPLTIGKISHVPKKGEF